MLYPRIFLALSAEQCASFTSCGLGSTKIGSKSEFKTFSILKARSLIVMTSSSGPILIVSPIAFVEFIDFTIGSTTSSMSEKQRLESHHHKLLVVFHLIFYLSLLKLHFCKDRRTFV